MATQDRQPTATGTANAWALGAGADKVDAVDDPIGTPDDDTTYISETTALDAQGYTFPVFSLGAVASIEKVSVHTRVRTTVAGTGTFRPRLRVNGTVYGGTDVNPTDSYVDRVEDWVTNPDTGAAWVQADLEGTGLNQLQQMYIRTTSIGTSVEFRCTQIFLRCTYTPSGAATRKGLSLLGVSCIAWCLLMGLVGYAWGNATYTAQTPTVITNVPDEALQFFAQLTRRDGKLVELWYDPIQRVVDLREFTPQVNGTYLYTAGRFIYPPASALGSLVAVTIDPADNTKTVFTYWDAVRGTLVLQPHLRQ